MTTTDWHHEKALRALGVQADVTIDGAGRVTLTLSDDDLDTLVESHAEHGQCEDRLSDAESEAHGVGYDTGREYGYEEAVSDIDRKEGAAWEVVAEMLAESYTQAIKDMQALARSGWKS